MYSNKPMSKTDSGNYNYRQYLIANSKLIQQQATQKAMLSCCYCNQCNAKNVQHITNYSTSGIYTTEPSDLQQNYNAYIREQARKASLNTHRI